VGHVRYQPLRLSIHWCADGAGQRRLAHPAAAASISGHRGTQRLHHFSTYIVDIHQLLAGGAARTALAYLTATPLAALAAVYAGIIVRGQTGIGMFNGCNPPLRQRA
jgi:hypothetical protein